VYQFLDIFINADIKKYEEFCSNHPTFLESNGLNSETYSRSIKLAALSRLCSSKPIISYSEVVSAIAVPDDDVEPLVVEAVMQGLIDVKMNQPQKTIAVRFAKRKYDVEEWKNLEQRVDTFRSNILDLMNVLKSVKEGNTNAQ